MMRPYVLALCKNESRNWLVYSNGLLWRSRNEFQRSKTKEKALCFMAGLVDQFRNQNVTLLTKCEYSFALGYPMKHVFMKELAEMY